MLLLGFFMTQESSLAQGTSEWRTVGLPGFSEGQAHLTQIKVSAQGIPYVAYKDASKSDKITVSRLVEANWEAVGSAGFSDAPVVDVSLEISKEGVPMVAYLEFGTSEPKVKKFNGTGWEAVGDVSPTNAGATELTLALSPNGTPYLAYADGANLYLGTVKRFNGSAWETVGQSTISTAWGYNYSLAFDSWGTPYLAFKDMAFDFKAVVKKFNGTSWEPLGMQGFTTGRADEISLAINSTGIPFMAFQDGAKEGKASVMFYNGGVWSYMGSSGFSTSQAVNITLAIGATNKLYVAFKDAGAGYKATVMTLNVAKWESLGMAGFSAGVVNEISMTLDAAGNPHVAYRDDSRGHKATVMQFSSRQPPLLVSQPVSQTIEATGTARFTVTATAANDLSYQWQVSTDNGSTYKNLENGVVYTGVSSNTLTIANAPISLSKNRYRVLLSNQLITFSEPAVLTVNLPVFATGNQWNQAGPPGFSSGAAEHVSMVMGADGKPIVAYSDLAREGKVTVMRFTGVSWAGVGSAGFSAAGAGFISLALDASGTTYVAYQDKSINGKATVLKFNGSAWVAVGTAGFSRGNATNLSLQINPKTQLPSVAFVDRFNNGIAATAMGFNGTQWTILGSSGFSESSQNGLANIPSLAFDLYGNLFAAYTDDQEQVSVKKLMKDSWQLVGREAFSDGRAQQVSIKADAAGTLYVVYSEKNFENRATVRRFNGTSWNYVGSNAFTDPGATQPSLALDKAGVPYVAYANDYFEARASVVRFNGVDWQEVGLAGFSAGPIAYINLAVNQEGVPFISFSDGGYNQKVTTMQFSPPPPHSITTQPLPVSTFSGENATFSVSPTGTQTLQYQWQVSQDKGQTYSNIFNNLQYSGANSPALLIKNVSLPMNGFLYKVQVQSIGVSSTAAALLTVRPPFFDHDRVWHPLGEITGRSSPVTAVDKQGIPYIVYAEENNANEVQGKISVKKFNGTTWENVGQPGFSSHFARKYKMAFDASNTPYVVFVNGDDKRHVIIMKFTGGQWMEVGRRNMNLKPGYASTEAHHVTFTVSAEGIPYIGYQEYENGNLTVWRLQGTTWENLGNKIFYPENNAHLALDKNSIPYIAYQDRSQFYGPLYHKPLVQKFNGLTWDVVGGVPLSDKVGYVESLEVDPSGVPYVLFEERHLINDNYTYTSVIKRFNGAKWEEFNPEIPVNETFLAHDLALDAKGTPFVLYKNGGSDNKPSVVRYNGLVWEQVGTKDFSDFANGYLQLDVSPAGIPFVTISSERYAVLRFGKKPSFLSHPVAASIMAGAPVSFTAHAASDWVTVRYAWHASADNGATYQPLASYDIYEGIDSPTLTFKKTPISLNGLLYRLQASNGYGFASESAQLTVHTPPPLSYTKWEQMGKTNATTLRTRPVSFAISPTGTPYVAFQDGFGGKASAITYTGTEWKPLGQPGLSEGKITNNYLAVTSEGTPYFFYNDPALMNTTNPNRFARFTPEGAWEFQENGMLNTTMARSSSLRMDKNDIFYITLQESGGLTTYHFLNDLWYPFGSTSTFKPAFNQYALGVSDEGGVSIFLSDAAQGNKATVIRMNFHTYEWETYGPAGFTDGAVTAVNMAVDVRHVPYIAFVEGEDVKVMYFTGSYWKQVGNTISNSGPSHLSLLLDELGVPIVTYIDKNDGEKVKVKKFNGTDWTTMGTSEVPGNSQNNAVLLFDPMTGAPLVAYAAKSVFESELVVMKLTNAVTSSAEEKHNLLQIYPNPTNHTFTVKTKEPIIHLELFNNLGVKILNKPGAGNESQLNVDVSALSSGLYFINVHTKGKKYTSRVVVAK
ncbi:T9SS type A sorting domain-containing protein [Rufibacter sp. LB8]|uniref:T9SS type A sorting domain-containing protein n=2 Tax=Rufibacter sp. LB8 TaxID=2777781 RepID=UPI001CEF72B4|nr:T9SS type A sorting domain-containing protein [Rufibacter sp. LB8]